jgi:hypothetical protein
MWTSPFYRGAKMFAKGISKIWSTPAHIRLACSMHKARLGRPSPRRSFVRDVFYCEFSGVFLDNRAPLRDRR